VTAIAPPRTKPVQLRLQVSQEVLQALRAAAQAEALPLAAFIRRAAYKAAGIGPADRSRTRKPTIYLGPRFEGRGRYKWVPWRLPTKAAAYWDRQARVYLEQPAALACGLPWPPPSPSASGDTPQSGDPPASQAATPK
jgi:hypothetical protein